MVEALRIVSQGATNLLARLYRQCDRIVSLFDRRYILQLHCEASLLQCLIHRIVLEHDQALEQRLAARHIAPRLHLHQRAMFVLAHLGLLYLQLPQPLSDARARRNLHPYG